MAANLYIRRLAGVFSSAVCFEAMHERGSLVFDGGPLLASVFEPDDEISRLYVCS